MRGIYLATHLRPRAFVKGTASRLNSLVNVFSAAIRDIMNLVSRAGIQSLEGPTSDGIHQIAVYDKLHTQGSHKAWAPSRAVCTDHWCLMQWLLLGNQS